MCQPLLDYGNKPIHLREKTVIEWAARFRQPLFETRTVGGGMSMQLCHKRQDGGDCAPWGHGCGGKHILRICSASRVLDESTWRMYSQSDVFCMGTAPTGVETCFMSGNKASACNGPTPAPCESIAGVSASNSVLFINRPKRRPELLRIAVPSPLPLGSSHRPRRRWRRHTSCLPTLSLS